MSHNLIDIVADGDTLIILPVGDSSDTGSSVSDVGAVVDEESVVDGEKDWADVETITDPKVIANQETGTTANESIRAAKRLKLSDGSHAEPETGTTEASQEIFHFRVSMRHLVLASSRAKAVLQGPFKESTPHESDGLLHWQLAPIFDPIAFETVMRIVHAQNKKVPEEVTLEQLANIAAIVDDLQCQESVDFFASLWAKKLAIKPPEEINVDLARCILISTVFGLKGLYESSTLQAILSSTGAMPVFGLPISPDALDAIDNARKDLLRRRLRRLLTIAEKYKNPRLCLSCRAGSLGLMHVNMHANNLPMDSSKELTNESLKQLDIKVKCFAYPQVDYRDLCKASHKQHGLHPSLEEDINHFIKHFYTNIPKLKLR
ncbi:hypothetical protein Trisim1_009101 [Trichoderma cf. simile WF8]